MNDVYDLLDELKNLGARIYSVDDKIKLEIKPGTLTSEISDKIKYYREDILSLLKESNKNSDFVKIEKVPPQESYAVSDGQRRLWFLSQFQAGARTYRIPGTKYLDSKVDVEIVKKSLWSILERHEILRTVYKQDDSGELRQWILSIEDSGFKIDYQDFRDKSNKIELMESYLRKLSWEEFDLENGPLFKASLIRLENEDYVLYYNVHHINIDGWSMTVLFKDFNTFYDAFKAGQTPNIPPLKFQYKDYAAWQLKMLEDESANSHRAFWLEALKGELPRLDLPSYKPRPKETTYSGAKYRGTFIGAQIISKLKEFSEGHGGSLYMGLVAAWNVLMYRYTAIDDITVGTPLNGREHADTLDQIGFYVNTLAIRNKLNPESDFNTAFNTVKQNMLDAYSHQAYPFNRLVEELNLPKNFGRNPVFDILLVYNSGGKKNESLSNDDSTNQMIEVESLTSKFDLDVGFQEIDDYIQVRSIYNPDIYEEETIDKLVKHYKQLLRVLLATPGESISQIDFLSDQEKQELLVTRNDTAVAYQKDKTIIDLLAEQVTKTPEQEAVVFEDTKLTYQQLDERSNQLAHYLRDRYDIQPDDLVGIKQERSEWMLISILGVLKSGGAYVPIDPEYPQERVDYIERDTSCKVMLDLAELSRFHESEGEYSSDQISTATQPDNLAYVIYTSGSTGKPKGVMIEHEAMLDYVLTFKKSFDLNEKDKVIQQSSISFDTHIEEIYPTLLAGGTLLIGRNGGRDIIELEELIRTHQATLLSATPLIINELNTSQYDLSSLRVLISGGDKFDISYVSNYLGEFSIYDSYGPTESTVCATYSEVKRGEHRSVIGKPFPNREIYVLSDHDKVQPIGVVGELHIGGAGLARGYLNQPTLTQEKFIASPFKEGERMYKTGDLGRWLPDGNIEFIGRKDDQVKIRGYRIELGEIEHALEENEEITQAIVLAKDNAAGEKELVAYLVADKEQNISELRGYLKGILPSYMLPAYYVQLQTIPLTANGKVNKKSLPDPEGLGLTSGVEYVAPGNETEERLVKIWEEVLQRENIGMKDDFFALGGHSLKAVRLSNEYQKQLSVKLTLKDLFAHTSLASHAALIPSSISESFVQIERVTPGDSYPISDGQRRLWVLSQFEGGLAAYNMPGSLKLNQAIEIEDFKRAINATIDRHEILRTVFRKDDSGEVRQWILERDEIGFAIDYQDFREAPNKRERTEGYIAADAYQAFDLERGPLLRAALLQVEENEYVFYYNMHHIISDGWSMEVLSKDVFSYYEAYQSGTTLEIQELRIQYKDYSSWQLAQLHEDSFKAHKAYWLDKLSREVPLLDLPTTKQRPKVKTYNGHGLSTYLDKATTAKLKGYIDEHGGSLFMGILASWNVLMYRYTSQEDIIIGTPVAGRDHADLEDQIGFYVNTLALRNEVKGEESFDRFYQVLKEDTFKSYSHQMYPFDRLVEDLDLQRDTSRNAVFDVMLILQNGEEMSEGIELSEEELTQIVDRGASTSKFDLEVTVQELEGYLSLKFVYNTDVYEQAMVERLMRHYKQLLAALLDTPDEKLAQIDYLSDQEKHELLVNHNDTAVAYPKDKTIIDLFEAQVAKTPDRVAVVFEDTVFTYRELDERSNQLAHYLKDQYDIQPDDLVGIKQDRSLWMIVSILGILKSGGAYVPIDPEYPQVRIDYIAKDTNCKVMLDLKELSRFQASEEEYSSDQISTATQPDNLAYVIYTSGSTGMPKGVMIAHHSLCNLCIWHQQEYGLNFNSRATMLSGVGFDASVWELFPYITSGGSVYPITNEFRFDANRLVELFNKHRITHAFMPTILYKDFVTKSDDLIQEINLCVGGEALLAYQKNEKIKLFNNYGPTENTVVTTNYLIGEKDASIIPIGKPISNTQLHIVNEKHVPQPIGVIGELLIGGDQIARGYLNQEELTREKFITSPFNEGERLYKTGDLGRWLPDGNIAFIGRKDDQVKVRGFRIELGEIEHALEQNKEIRQAVVLAKENESGEKELVAYITSDVEQNINALGAFLKERLPSYMLPVYYVQLDELPLTANGKVDKKSLPDPEGLGLTSGSEYVAPRNEIEEKLVKIWEEVLQRGNIGVKDDFFMLGGHSLKAIRLSNEYQKGLAVTLTLQELFTYTSIATQAELIASSTKSTFVQIEKVAPHTSYAISDGQRRLWVLSQFEGGSTAYNIPRSIYLTQDVEIEHFKQAIDAAIDRHEILRTVFREDESGEVRQWILDREELGFVIDYQDFRGASNKREKTEGYIAADAFQPFDLEQGPLLRAALLQVEEEEYVFYYNMHHIISDGWSMEVLSKDVFSYYEAYQSGKMPEIKDLRIQYKDYSSWQLAQLNEESFKEHQSYWLDRLSGELPLLDLPSTKYRPMVKTYSGHGLSTYLDKSTTAKLKGYIEEHGGSLFMGILASWNVLMYRYTSQEDIIIGTPVAGRDHADLEDQIGFYVNTLALRNEVKGEVSFDRFYQVLKEDTFKSYSHQMYPFDRLVEDLDLQRDTSRSAVFDVMLILQNGEEMTKGVELSEEELTQIVDQGASTSKFDLEFTVQELGGYLSLKFVYNTDVYEQDMVEGLIRHYKQVLRALLTTPGEKISQIDFLSDTEKQDLLRPVNNQGLDYPKDKTIVALFEEQVSKTGSNTALVFRDKKLSYDELDSVSNQLAHYLIETYKIGSDDLVGVMLNRSEWSIISILGILKAGGAYVPIDPEDASSRKDAIINDASLKVLITEVDLIDGINYDGDVFTIDEGFKPANYSSDRLPVTSVPDDIAYVIYTSGSTGKPKGVMVPSRAIVDYSFGVLEKTNMRECESFGLVSTISADLGNTVIYPSLLIGGCLHIIAKEDIIDVEKLRGFELDCIKMTPSHWKSLQHVDDHFMPKRCLILGGEPFSEEILRHVNQIDSTCEVYNHYGPTEATIGKLIKHVDRSENTSRVSLGKPIGNNQVYVLNEAHQLCPIGVTGELCISGVGLARGYLNEENLTREKFVSNPFNEGNPLYKTGDLGKKRSNGEIEFVGRVDEQVKIRGYRIELGEIEHVLEENKEITQAIVLAKDNASEEKELVAYIVATKEQNISELRGYLNDILPSYMLPAYYVQLETMPLTANGKVDKKLLPDPEDLGLTSGMEYVAPRNKTEGQLVKIWEEVLRKENIGVNDDFFTLGGHSLKAIRLINEYQKVLAVKLTLQELFTYTSIASHAELIASSTKSTFVQIEKVAPQTSYSLSDGQRRLWVLSQFEGGSTAYNMPRSIFLTQDVETDHFKQAIDAAIDRHEILRTVFREDDSGEVRQWILDREELGFVIDYQDFRGAPNKREKTEGYIAADAYQPFDLAQGPLLRAALLQVEENEYVFYYNMHHIISDGWSMEVLSKDVFSYYEAYQSGTIPEIQKLRIQYKDYSSWQLDRLNEKSFEAHQSYWLDRLSGEVPLLDLPTTKQRPKVKTYNGYGLSTYLDKATTAKLKGYIDEHGGSLFMGILASWNVLMYRYTSQEDIIIGTPVAGRDHADLEDQIGFYVNTLVLRNEVKGEESFDRFYQVLKEDTFKSYSHQMYPFDRLVEDLDLQRDTSRSAVFDVMLVLQNNMEMPEEVDLSEEALTQIVDHGTTMSKFDLEVTIVELGGYLSLNFVYNTDVYEQAMIEGLIRHYKQLLGALLDTPNEKLAQIDYLSDQEKHELLVNHNDTAVAYPKDKTIIDLFEAQVAKTPDRVAVVFEDTEFTYRELDERSNQLAHYLKDQYDIQPDDLVGIKQDRSLWMIVSILGILKSGGAYVPIDPEYPQVRIDYIAKDTNCKVMLDLKELSRFQASEEEYSSDQISTATQPDNLAYVIYTSGSTGMPKGVMVAHHSLCNLCNWHQQEYGLNFNSRATMLSGVGFDASVWELFPYITSGGSVYPITNEFRFDANRLVELFNKHRITHAFMPTILYKDFVTKSDDLIQEINLCVGGEALLAYQKNEKIKLFNNYGPTENTVVTTNYLIGENDASTIPIGKPISNTQVHIVNEKHVPQPIGVIGELLIGGDQIARGYLNQEELTREKFITSPFNEGERLYKTGDLGRWLPDGNIAFIGRKDDQVKVRGFRIELGEIEHALEQNKEIRQAVVLAKENESGEKELVAYITSDVEQNINALRSYLKERLPSYMLPIYYVQLDELPLTANGKVDKKSLPDPEGLGLTSGSEYVAPRNEIEEQLVKIWEEVLQRGNIGVKDDFFMLGGNSLTAIDLVNRINRNLGLTLSNMVIFELQTITEIYEEIQRIESINGDN